MALSLCKTIADYPTADGSMAFWFSIRDCIPYSYEGLLICIFLVLFFANYFITKNKTGRTKILISLLSSSIVLVVLSLFLALSQLIAFTIILFWAFISIVSFIVLQVSDKS